MSSLMHDVFSTLSDSSRLGMVADLALGDRSVSELAAPRGLSIQAARKHLAVLEKAGLVASEKRGRVRVCRLTPQPLLQAQAWLGGRLDLWTRRLDALDRVLQEESPR